MPRGRTGDVGKDPGVARRRRPGRRVVIGAALLVLLTACDAASSPSTPRASVSVLDPQPNPVRSTSAASSMVNPSAGQFAGVVSIGGGRRLYLQCSGTGSPTVVLISGAGVAGDNWSYVGSATDQVHPAVPSPAGVYPRSAQLSRVCAYDRPGTTLWMVRLPGRRPLANRRRQRATREICVPC